MGKKASGVDGGVAVVKLGAVEWESTGMAEITEGPDQARLESLIGHGGYNLRRKELEHLTLSPALSGRFALLCRRDNGKERGCWPAPDRVQSSQR